MKAEDCFITGAKILLLRLRWDSLGKVIEVCKVTRPGSLTSTLLLNLFYKDLIDEDIINKQYEI